MSQDFNLGMKYFISHRGNVNGKSSERENTSSYIQEAISGGYDVEIDIWIKKSKIYLGHDGPEQNISLEWLTNRKDKLWIHCKSLEALTFFNECNVSFNYFFHDSDEATLTSKGFIWVYPGKQPVKNSIAVMPEINDDNFADCIGVCSDFIQNYTTK
jgi:hypothetical protein